MIVGQSSDRPSEKGAATHFKFCFEVLLVLKPSYLDLATFLWVDLGDKPERGALFMETFK